MRINDWNQVEQQEGELREYRGRTIALLLKYFRMSVELGHLPSLFGREFFRSNVSSYATHTFEDTVIFVLDMERCLARLSADSQQIIACIFFQEYTYDEAAPRLGLSRRHLVRKVALALDSCARIFLDAGLLARVFVPLSASTVSALSEGDELPPKMPPTGTPLYHKPLFPKYCQVGRGGRVKLRG